MADQAGIQHGFVEKWPPAWRNCAPAAVSTPVVKSEPINRGALKLNGYGC